MDEKFVFMEPGKVWGYQGRELVEKNTEEALKELERIHNSRKAVQLALHCVLRNERMIVKDEQIEKRKHDPKLPNYRLERLKRSLDFFKNVMELYTIETLLKANNFGEVKCSSKLDIVENAIGF